MRICFVDLSTHLNSIHDLETKGRGGIVTSLFKVSDYLSQRGHDVWVLSDVKEKGQTSHGTKWVSEPPDALDMLVCNRGTGPGYPDIQAKHRLLWTHDLPHAGYLDVPKIIKAFSATVFMSEYAETIWRYYYKDIGRSFLIPNGVDKDIFYPREKDLSYLIYCSAPNRGLKELPFLFDCLKQTVKRTLRMRAYSNLSKLHPGEEDTFSEDYKLFEGSGVELLEPIPQKELAEEIGKAGLMIIPSQYPEICSNSILQSIVSGTPVVTTGNLGSSYEWVNDCNGRLTDWMPHDYMVYKIDLLRKASKILNNESIHRKLIRGCLNTKIFTWEEIGDQWERMLKKLH